MRRIRKAPACVGLALALALLALPAQAIASPAAATEAATDVTATSATLRGHVDPAGGPAVFKCFFEYGLSTSYGAMAQCAPSPPFSSPTNVTASLLGLQEGAIYHYRVVAVVEPMADEFAYGGDLTFCTCPSGLSGGFTPEPIPVLPPTPLPQPKPPGCPDVAIYGVRGSGEDYKQSELGMGPAVHAIAQKLLRRIPASDSVLESGLPYQAADARLAVFGGLGRGPYNDSVLEGADLLVNGRKRSHGLSAFEGIGPLVARCPTIKLVLIGLSQGAQVITTALAQASHATVVTRQISAILLYGNPIRLRNKPYDVGTNAHDGALAAAGLQPGGIAQRMPRFLWPITQSYCLPHDPICAFSEDDFAHHLDVHSTYAGSQFAKQGADFAGRMLGSS